MRVCSYEWRDVMILALPRALFFVTNKAWLARRFCAPASSFSKHANQVFSQGLLHMEKTSKTADVSFVLVMYSIFIKVTSVQ